MDEDDVVHLDEGGQEDHLRGQPAGQVDGGDDDEWVGNDSGMTLLDFERDTLTSTLPDSVLFVVANGLGIERLFLEHLVLFSDRRLLAIVLNTTPHDENYLIGKMKEMNLGCEPKIINADVNTKDREAVYLEGGVQFCSTRVVLVDLLQSRLPVGRVAAILVYRAHNVLTSFQESFVLRLYREKKADGLVKAFTDVPSSLSSIGQLQRLVNRLYVKHVKLIPRFSFDVEHELSQCQLRSAVFSVDVSQSMRRVHRTLLDLIKVCVRDLRACSTTGKQAPNEPVEEISQVPYNVTFLERKLKERRSFMTDKQVRLVADSALLRELLQMAESLDAATVLNKLLVLKSDRQMIEESSGWLMSPTAGRMVEDLQTLCGGSGGFAKFITPPKWDVLVDVLNEVKQIPVDEKELPEHGPSVLVMANAEDVCRQLLDVVRHGLQKAKWMCWRQLGRPCDSPTPPDEPLWPPEHVSLFTRSQLGMRPDARSEMVANVQKAQKAVARATQKKRKAAENLIGRFNSKIQTTIVQFGILHYKRRKTQLASSEVEVKEEAPDEDEQVPTTSAAAHATVKTIGEYDNVELVVMPQGERYSTMKFLEQRKPTVIILYTMSLLSMRQIEIYRACHPNLHLQVYCMQYRDSTEEGRYLESMNRETIAFESLIREQGTLLIPRQFDVQREDAPRIKPSTRDGGGQAAATSSTVDDADATPADVERPKVIVDMREFNSELPTVLYTKGFDVVAATLEVGDYVLSSSIAVERKALDDLAQSLQSGRVFKQIEQMLEHYANTILLVESNQKFELKIVNGGPFQGELSRHCREIRARLCTLIRTQPRLKCVWAMSPMNSAEFFAELKLNSDEPDLLTAVSLRGDHVAQEANEADRPSTSGNKKRKVNNTIQRALTTHLDMKVGDAQRLLTAGKINTLAELFSSNTSTKKLEENLPASQVDFIKILATFDFSERAAEGRRTMFGGSGAAKMGVLAAVGRRSAWRRFGRPSTDDDVNRLAAHLCRRSFATTSIMASSDAAADEKVVAKHDMRKFMVACMRKVGASDSHAGQLADVLIEGDVRGHYSHGLNRLDMYVRDVEQKVCNIDGEPKILKERAGTAWVDGNNLLGPVVGNFCMDLAVKKAKEAGVGWIVAKGSNHYGIAGWYALRAMKNGCLGMSMTNTSPISYPTRATAPALGTNPLSLGAPAKDGDAFVLDMATTTVAVGKIELANRKGVDVPTSWGVGAGGKETTKTAEILDGGGLLPLGGTEISGGYKGYGMCALVEIFCGVLAGAHWGPHVRKWLSTAKDADLGQCFIAIDPDAFAPGFAERMQDFVDTMRNLQPADPAKPVLVAGDPEREHEKLVEKLGGIPYHPNQIKFIVDLAEKLGVEKPKIQ